MKTKKKSTHINMRKKSFTTLAKTWGASLALFFEFFFPLQAYGEFVSMKNFCQEIEKLFCQKKPQDNCEAKLNQKKHQCMEFLNPLLEAKSVRFQSDQAKLCLNAHSPTFPPVACSQVFEGLTLANKACEWSTSCKSPLICKRDSGSLMGICQAPLNAGAACNRLAYSGSLYIEYLVSLSTPCKNGLSCAEVSPGLTQCR